MQPSNGGSKSICANVPVAALSLSPGSGSPARWKRCPRRKRRWGWWNAPVVNPVFGWGSTLLTWPLFQWGGSFAGMLDISVSETGITQVWIGYIVVTWTVTAIVAGLLGQRRRQSQEGSTI